MATQESLELTESINNRRYYNIKKEMLYKLPSVTTVIGAMSDQSGIEAWKKRVGEQEAEKISKFSANRGTCMHQKLEYWFLSDIKDPQERLIDCGRKMIDFVKENGYTIEELKVGNQLFDNLMNCGFFERVKSIVQMEETLYSLTNGGYAGRVDCIYENHAGEHVLLDFKTARHQKKEDWLTGYYLQLSAYWIAWYQMTGETLDHAELWISVENDTPQLVYVNQDKLKEYGKLFIEMVRNYHLKYDYLLPSKNKAYVK